VMRYGRGGECVTKYGGGGSVCMCVYGVVCVCVWCSVCVYGVVCVCV